MGKLSQGINGPFTGSVGPVVGTTWKGMPVIRSKPDRRKPGFSAGELAQQMKFKQMSHFLSPVISLLNDTFKPLAIRMTGFNKAYSYNVKNAFSGLYPDLKIDYSMILLGRGDLPNAGSPAAALSSPVTLDFSWTDNSGKGKARETDKAFVAAYSEEMNKWKFKLNAADQGDSRGNLDITGLEGRTLYSWLGFISADSKEVTDSIFTGIVQP